MTDAQTREGLNAIADYCGWLAKLPPSPYVFRGHADSDWVLVPSVGRAGGKGISSQAVLNRWKRLAGPVAGLQPTSEIGWLVLAQHYSVPTPLLDWTTSPLAALYFACCEFDDRWAHVYALPTTPFEEYDDLLLVDPFGATERELVLLPTESLNARAIAQRSVMTLHRPPSTNAWAVKGENDDGHLGLTIEFYPVKSEVKSSVRAALSVLGFNAITMMADVHNAAKEFCKAL